MKVIDLTGKRFGRLIALHTVSTKGRAIWLCRCDCGNTKTVRGTHLTQGLISSCKCLQTEFVIPRKHGRSRSRVYRIWRDMLSRCHNENYPERHLYGGRGIEVCERWRYSFENFLADMGEPAPELSIDRFPNKDGNYEPGNCRWATAKEQAGNRRPPVFKDGQNKRWEFER